MDVQPLEGVRVLVVEDDDDTREMMSCLLEESGALVTSAGCVAEAFAVFVGQKPNVVVSDIGLPGKSGYDLVSRIRSLPPQLGRDTPIIAVSAQAEYTRRKVSRAHDFTVYVNKPFEVAALLGAVCEQAGRCEPGAASKPRL
jgi:CheY-like chemotaxis protein